MRHTKPFHCIESSCNRQFGSKGDWMRHVNSQHFMEEKWLCNLCDQNKNQVFYRRESFQSHLRTQHGKKENKDLKKLAQDCRQERDGIKSYWCGFCKKRYDPPDLSLSDHQEQQPFEDRFDHIANHFVQENRDWSGWRWNSDAASGIDSSQKAVVTASGDRKDTDEDENRHRIECVSVQWLSQSMQRY
jgi:hypothetical protein